MTGHVSALNTFAYGNYLIAGIWTTETHPVCPNADSRTMSWEKPNKNENFATS